MQAFQTYKDKIRAHVAVVSNMVRSNLNNFPLDDKHFEPLKLVKGESKINRLNYTRPTAMSRKKLRRLGLSDLVSQILNKRLHPIPKPPKVLRVIARFPMYVSRFPMFAVAMLGTYIMNIVSDLLALVWLMML